MPLPDCLYRIWWRWRSGASHCQVQPCRLFPTGGVFLEYSSSLSVRHRLRITIGSAAPTPNSPMRAPWKEYVLFLEFLHLLSLSVQVSRGKTSPVLVCLALYQGTTSVVPLTEQKEPGFSQALAPAVARPARNTKFESNFSLRVALLGQEKTAGAKAQHCFRPVRHD
jgi:hypothetical protein